LEHVSWFFFVAGRSGLTIGLFPTVRQEVPMKEEKTTLLRQRMIEDMDIRGLCEKTQKGPVLFCWKIL